jgi:MFS family permease
VNSNDRRIVGLVALAHAMVHTYELSIPIFVTVWLTEFTTTKAELGLVVAAGYALFGLGSLPGGILADRVGSRRLIAGCLFGMAGSFVLLSFSPTLPVLALALVVWGVAASVYHPSGLSLISKGVQARGNAFAYHGIAGNLGIAFGPFATALLLLVLDWRTTALVLAVPAILAGAIAVRARFDEHAAVEDAALSDGGSKSDASVSSLAEFLAESRRLFTGPFVAVFLIVICSGLYYRGVLTFMPELLADFPVFDPMTVASQSIEPARYVYAALLVVGVGGQYVGGKLTDRLQTEHGIAIAFGALVLLALSFLPAVNAGFGAFVVVGALLGFTLFVVQPLYQATVAEYTPAGTRGLSYGFTYLGVFGIGAFGAAIAGSVLEYWDAPALFLVLAGFASVASLTAVGLSLRGRR